MSSRIATPMEANPETAQLSASERAYSYVKERILDGEFEGGALISEGEIADTLGISRTPVREGFLRLQAEGWMRLYPKRGAAITPIMPREIEQVIEARALIESHAVDRICADATRTGELAVELRSIVSHQADCLAAGDLSGFAVADADFHQCIVTAGDNGLLEDFYGGLRDRQRRMTINSLARTQDATTRIIEQHRALADLIEHRDADGFRKAIQAHLGDIHGR